MPTSDEKKIVFAQVLIRFNYLESMLKQQLLAAVQLIHTEAPKATVFFHFPIVKFFCLTELALQGYKLLTAIHLLLGNIQNNPALAHSVRVLHRTLFDCEMRMTYLHSLDNNTDKCIFIKYLYSGVLDGFRSNCRVVAALAESDNPDTWDKTAATCLKCVTSMIDDYDGEWVFEEARAFNVSESELAESPILHFASNKEIFSEKVESLKAALQKYQEEMTPSYIQDMIAICKELNSHSQYTKKASVSTVTKGKPMYGSDWWPSSSELYIVFDSIFDQHPIDTIWFYEALFHGNSSYVHPNINNSSERLSLDEIDEDVFWNHAVLIDSFEKVLRHCGIITAEAASTMHAIEQEAQGLLRKLGLGPEDN